jgi:hypothetical protein
MARKALLLCGVLSSRLYVAMNVFVTMPWEGSGSRPANGQPAVRGRRSASANETLRMVEAGGVGIFMVVENT